MKAKNVEVTKSVNLSGLSMNLVTAESDVRVVISRWLKRWAEVTDLNLCDSRLKLVLILDDHRDEKIQSYFLVRGLTQVRVTDYDTFRSAIDPDVIIARSHPVDIDEGDYPIIERIAKMLGYTAEKHVRNIQEKIKNAMEIVEAYE